MLAAPVLASLSVSGEGAINCLKTSATVAVARLLKRVTPVTMMVTTPSSSVERVNSTIDQSSVHALADVSDETALLICVLYHLDSTRVFRIHHKGDAGRLGQGDILLLGAPSVEDAHRQADLQLAVIGVGSVWAGIVVAVALRRVH